ncbi:MAG: PAC2 family protein [Thermoplasmata archaeon]
MRKEDYKIIIEDSLPDVETLVAGFPGIGLIGGMASEYLINSLPLHEVASIHCDDFPPTAVIFDGIPRRPVRFFAGKSFLLVKSDMVIPSELSFSMAETIIDWATEQGIKEVIIFDGLPEVEDSDGKKIWGAISSHSAEKQARKLNVDLIQRGAISGIASALLLYAHEMKLEAIAMLAESNVQMPDPRASAALLDKFADYCEIEVETSSLLESAEQLEEQYSQLADKTQKVHDEMKHRSAHPPIYG